MKMTFYVEIPIKDRKIQKHLILFVQFSCHQKCNKKECIDYKKQKHINIGWEHPFSEQILSELNKIFIFLACL